MTRPGQTHRSLYLPRGRWQHWWRGTLYEGPGWITVEASLEEIPLFLREGHAVPLTEPRAAKTAFFEPLYFRAFPEGQSRGEVYLDAGDGHDPGTRYEALVNVERRAFKGPRGARAFIQTKEGNVIWLD